MIEIFGSEYSQRKQYREATHRTRSPRETIEDYSRFMPRMGIRASWVPYDSATMNMVFPAGYSPDFCISSNGLASGNHILEAIEHALCEVIERDADALWRADDRLAQLDLETVTDPYCRFVI